MNIYEYGAIQKLFEYLQNSKANLSFIKNLLHIISEI